ncbi:MAG: VacB/RNase II family 3'-5' exoribonuclease, partial [Planctomycetota bacterium]
PSGEVIAVVGDEQTYKDDLAIVRSEYRLPTEFPPEVQAEVEKLPRDVGPAEIKGRVDRRGETVITIDPSDARDFDDAITVRREKGGRFRVGVFIADVAAYVKAGSAIDKEALERGTSVYLPGLVIPMLPERLSNDLCSLRPRVDRLARGVWMTVEKDGSLGDIELERSVICSRHRFTYGEAQTVIEGETLQGVDDDLIEMIEVANELRGLLRGRREKTGSLNLDLDAQRLVLDDDGEVAEIRVERGDESHQLVEECMLLANEAVARVATERDIPILRRVHPEPSEEDIDEFIAFCQTVIPSLKLNGAGDLQRAVDAVRGKPEAPVVNFALLRTLTQATYSAEAGLHFALAKEEYCHFTSPIRRYPDLQVHRALDARLFKDRMPKAWKAQVDNLEDIAGLCSRRERQAEEAEREMTKLRVISWLRRHIGERFTGIVTGVLEYGFFVRLDESLAEGMVHVRHLGDDYFEYQERDRSLRGRSSGRVYRLGTRVEVELVRADPVDRHVDLQVIQPDSDDEQDREDSGRRGGQPSGDRRSSRKKRGRRR